MSQVALTSGKHFPGVSTLSLALDAVWPTELPVIVAECDAAGSDIAPRFGLNPNLGVVSLAATARRGISGEDLAAALQVVLGGVEVLVGPATPDQGHAMASVWGPMAAALGGLGTVDVIADCGRVGPGSSASRISPHADVTLVMTRPTPEGVAHADAAISALHPGAAYLGVVVRGPRSAVSEVEAALRVPVLGAIPEDHRAAAILWGEPGGRRYLERAPLIRAARELADAIAELLPSQASAGDAAAAFGELGPEAPPAWPPPAMEAMGAGVSAAAEREPRRA